MSTILAKKVLSTFVDSYFQLVPRQNTQRRNAVMSLLTLLGLSGTSLPRLQEEPVLPSSSDP